MSFRHCTIVGLGLLGGSLAIDLRAADPAITLTGIARRQATLDEAARLQSAGRPVFTHLTTDLAVVREADLVVLCTPVQTIITQLAEMAPVLAPETIVTDVGSTKRAIMNAAATALPTTVSFVGGHPMAGSEQTGLTAARAGLYRGATWALCVPANAVSAGTRLVTLIEALGAHPITLDPETHDEIVAATSHLPHLLAAALTNCVLSGRQTGADLLPSFLAGGFRDATRVAAGSPPMWRDIFLTNRDQVLVALERLMEELAGWRGAIRSGDAPHLEALLTTAQHRRERL